MEYFKEYTRPDISIHGVVGVLESLRNETHRTGTKQSILIRFSHCSLDVAVDPAFDQNQFIIDQNRGKDTKEIAPLPREAAIRFLVNQFLESLGSPPPDTMPCTSVRELGGFHSYLARRPDVPSIANHVLPFGILFHDQPASLLLGWLPLLQTTQIVLCTSNGDPIKTRSQAKAINDGEQIKDFDLALLDDHLLILARSEDGTYWYFSFDCSERRNCSLGRFRTCDEESLVVAHFLEYATDLTEQLEHCDQTRKPWHVLIKPDQFVGEMEYSK